MRMLLLFVFFCVGKWAAGQTVDSAKAFMFRTAKVLYSQEQYDAAIPILDQCIAIDATDAAVFNLRACATILRGNVDNRKNNDTAIGYFTQAILLAPEEARFLANRGWSLQSLERYQASLADFRKAVQLDSTNLEIFSRLLMGLYVQDMHAEALEVANKIVTRFPDDGYAWYVRGQLKKKYLQQEASGIADVKHGEALGWRKGFWLFE